MGTYSAQILDIIYKLSANGWHVEIESYPLIENGVRITVYNGLHPFGMASGGGVFDANSSMRDLNMLNCLKSILVKLGLVDGEV